MNTSDWLRKLPSVNEILERPQVKALADRLNRSTVTARVRSYLDQLRSEYEQRKGDFQVPALSELADRAARFVLGSSPHSGSTVINGTGELWGEFSPPLASGALQRIQLLGQGYVTGAGVLADAESLSSELTGAEASLFFHSSAGALELAFSTLRDKRVIVARREVGNVLPGYSVIDLLHAAGCEPVEIGVASGVMLEEYAKVATGPEFVILRAGADAPAARPTIEELADLAKQRGTVLVAEIGRGPLVEDLPTDGRPVESAQRCVRAGVDIVIVRTDGLIGGPEGALVLGNRNVIDAIRALPRAGLFAPTDLAVHALAATLDLYRRPEQVRFQIPLLSLLDTPLENLKQRAERLAPQLAVSPLLSAANAISLTPPRDAREAACQLASWGIALAPREGGPEQLRQHLASRLLPIRSRTDAGGVVLDLRTVLPAQDTDLVDQFTA